MHDSHRFTIKTSTVDAQWVRHPADAARFALAAVVAGALVGTIAAAPGETVVIARDIVRLCEDLPAGTTGFLVGIVQLIALVAPIVAVVALAAQRRFRVIGLLALAAAVSAFTVALVNSWLAARVPSVVIQRRLSDSWLTGAAFPSTAYLAAAMAVIVAANAWLRSSWRRAAWAVIAAIAFCRLLTATEVPLNLGVVLAIGAACGSLALVMTGAPPRRTDESTLRFALARVGIDVARIVTPPGEAHAVAFDTTTEGGEQLRVRVVGRDDRDVALVLRLWRALTKKGLGDRRPIASSRRAAEYEMLALALAGSAGAHVPQPVAIAFTTDEAALVAVRNVDGIPLATLDPSNVDDIMLVDLWRQVGTLHARRIAHRALHVEHVRVGDRVAITEFTLATLDASDEVLGADTANLLTSLAVFAGIDRAVGTALEGLGRDALAAALPLIQPTVLTPSVRRQSSKAQLKLPALRDAAQHATGVEKVELSKIHRVTLKGIVSLAGSVVLGGYLLSLAANWSDTWSVLRHAHVSDCVLLIVFMVVSYVGGALSLIGAVVIDLPFFRTLAVLFAQSFLNRFTPANSGGMALRVRYVQLEGADVTVAAAAVGLTSAASGIAQVAFIAVFLVWGGATNSLGHFSLPSVAKVLTIAIVLGAVAGTIALSGWGRRVVVPVVTRTMRKVLDTVSALARRPDKIAILLGGAFLAKFVAIVSFAIAVHAYGVHMGLAQAGALFMVGSTVGSAVPTPGGVGGVEAALTAALLGAGVDAATATAIVVLYRLVTFWLPTLPQWAMLQYTQHAGIV